MGAEAHCRHTSTLPLKKVSNRKMYIHLYELLTLL